MKNLNNTPLSIIIVNFKSKGYLKNCLFSIKDKFYDFPEVIVVNNDKEEDLRDLKEQFPEIKIFQNKNNAGFGGANNKGARAASGKNLFFLNPDTEVISSGEKILNRINNLEDILSLGLVEKTGKIQEWACGTEITLWRLIGNKLGFYGGHRKLWQGEKNEEVSWVSGAALLIPRKLFLDDLKGFDEDFFMYFEDVDLCKRAQNLGKKVFYDPTVSVKHLGGKSSISQESQKKMYYNSQSMYFKKHRSPVERHLLFILNKVFNRKFK